MDSLLQNARAPYPALFARYVVPMLCRTYEFVRGADFWVCLMCFDLGCVMYVCPRPSHVPPPPPRVGRPFNHPPTHNQTTHARRGAAGTGSA